MTSKPLPDFDEYQDFPTFRVADDPETRAAAIEHIDDMGVRAFLGAHPEFHQCDENAKLLVGFLGVRGGLPLTRRNLEIAYYDLREDDLLKAAPAPDKQTVDKWASVVLTRADVLAKYVPFVQEATQLAKVADDPNLNDHQRKARLRKLALLAGAQRRGTRVAESLPMTVESERVVNEAGTQLLRCRDCGKEFPFPPGEQRFFREKGFPPPRRCKPCRRDQRDKRQSVERRTPSDAIHQLLGRKECST